MRLVTLGYGILQAEDALDKSLRPPSDASDRRKLFALARGFLSQVVCQIYVVRQLSQPLAAILYQTDLTGQLINTIDPGINAIVANIIESGHGPGPRGYRFNTATDAHHVLNSIRLQFDRYEEGAIETARSNLAAWTLAFGALKRATPKHLLSATERRAFALLELRRLYFDAEISVNIVRGPVDPMLWDAHRDYFLKMLALAEIAMDVDDREGDSASPSSGSGSGSEADRASAAVERDRKKSPWFCMSSGAVVVVYGIVQKCRDADIRQRALQLLASQNRQEGIWSSRMVLGAVLRLVAIEEYGLDNPRTCADIPPENRVRTIRVVKKTPDDYTVGYALQTGWIWEDANAFL